MNEPAPQWDIGYADHLSQQEELMYRSLAIHQTCSCDRDVHKHQPTAFACNHCVQQDEVNPVGIIRMPKGYFLCADCFNLLQRCKLQFVHEVATHCSTCIWDEIRRIIAINPALFTDKYDQAQHAVDMLGGKDRFYKPNWKP